VSQIILRVLNCLRRYYERKMSKSSDDSKQDIVITDEIKIKALQSEVKYWKGRYDLMKKCGNSPVVEYTVDDTLKHFADGDKGSITVQFTEDECNRTLYALAQWENILHDRDCEEYNDF